MKKNSIFGLLFGIAGSTLLLSAPINNNINTLNTSNSKYEENEFTHVMEVDSAESLINALNANPYGSYEQKVIVLTQDISLAGVTADDLDIVSPTAISVIIDGDGYSITNKPSDLFFTPLIKEYKMESTTGNTLEQSFIVKNLTLDSVGSFIGGLEEVAIGDISDSNRNDLYDRGISFQNITIKNNVLDGQNTYVKSNIFSQEGEYYDGSKLSLLVNNINISHEGQADHDESLNFYNIHIEDNIIQNNYLNIESSVDRAAFSFLTNIQYEVCTDPTHSHQSFLNFEYIFINNNTFKNNIYTTNDFNQTMKNSSESASSLIGSLDGLNDWKGSGGNYIFVSDIFITNNVIGSSNVSKENFNYSELIATSGNSNQWLSVNLFENIFAFNNKAFSYSDNHQRNEVELNAEDQLPIINLSLNSETNNSSNTWNELNSNNLYFYGDMFDEEITLNLFPNSSGNVFNGIHYGKYLSVDSEDYSDLVILLDETYGIYNYQISTEIITDENGNEIEIVSDINSNLEDEINIISINSIYGEDKTETVGIELNFKFYAKSSLDNVVTQPYTFKDLQISDGNGNIYATSSENATTNSTKNYIYQVEFDLVTPIVITQEWIDSHSLDNVYLEFNIKNTINYDSNTREAGNGFDQSIKLDSEQLNLLLSDLTVVEESENATALIITASVTGFIVFLILLILLILLLIYLSRKRKLEAEGNVQDGYYEYVDYNETDDNSSYSDSYYSDNSNDYDYYNNYDYENPEYNQENFEEIPYSGSTEIVRSQDNQMDNIS